jgi:glyoxylase-like metal-dependent hydrolase (beta-lactamase superfamily II)
MAAARQAIPGKPIRYVVNSHPHFDHASGLATAVAEGATILTHQNNKAFLEKMLANPRTLVGDSLAKANRKPIIEGVGDRRTLKGSNGKVVELYHVQGLEHSDGMLMVYLPAEKAIYTADFAIPNPPAAGAAPAPAVPPRASGA